MNPDWSQTGWQDVGQGSNLPHCITPSTSRLEVRSPSRIDCYRKSLPPTLKEVMWCTTTVNGCTLCQAFARAVSKRKTSRVLRYACEDVPAARRWAAPTPFGGRSRTVDMSSLPTADYLIGLTGHHRIS